VNRFLAGFSDELSKLAESRVNPFGQAETKMEKLLKGGLKRYVGSPEVRHPTFPPMAEVASRGYTDKTPKVDARPPRPPR
jgi:hypothetical protein